MQRVELKRRKKFAILHWHLSSPKTVLSGKMTKSGQG